MSIRQRPAAPPDEYLIRVPIIDGMNEQAILNIRPELVKVTDNRDTTTLADTVEIIFNRSEEDHLYRKVLITCFPGDELQQLRDKFKGMGIAVAWTSAATKKWISIPGEEDKEIKLVSDFSKQITEYEGNMVILHIRQMTAGVDVSAITSVILRVFDNTAQNIVKMIQTNGRALRFASGERGKPEDERLKKYGEVYCMVQEESWTEDSRFLIRFFNLIYGTKAVSVFRIGSNKTAIKLEPPTIGEVEGHVPDLPGEWSEPEFYLLKLIKDRMSEIEFGRQTQDQDLQTAILTDLVRDMEQATEITQSFDATWYTADHCLSHQWTLEDLSKLFLFR